MRNIVKITFSLLAVFLGFFGAMAAVLHLVVGNEISLGSSPTTQEELTAILADTVDSLQAQKRQLELAQSLSQTQAQLAREQVALASLREEMSNIRLALEQEQQRNEVQGEVLARTQQALSESSSSVVGISGALTNVESKLRAELQAVRQQLARSQEASETVASEVRPGSRIESFNVGASCKTPRDLGPPIIGA